MAEQVQIKISDVMNQINDVIIECQKTPGEKKIFATIHDGKLEIKAFGQLGNKSEI